MSKQKSRGFLCLPMHLVSREAEYAKMTLAALLFYLVLHLPCGGGAGEDGGVWEKVAYFDAHEFRAADRGVAGYMCKGGTWFVPWDLVIAQYQDRTGSITLKLRQASSEVDSKPSSESEHKLDQIIWRQPRTANRCFHIREHNLTNGTNTHTRTQSSERERASKGSEGKEDDGGQGGKAQLVDVLFGNGQRPHILLAIADSWPFAGVFAHSLHLWQEVAAQTSEGSGGLGAGAAAELWVCSGCALENPLMLTVRDFCQLASRDSSRSSACLHYWYKSTNTAAATGTKIQILTLPTRQHTSKCISLRAAVCFDWATATATHRIPVLASRC